MVCEIERDMPSSELTEWMAYYRLEPFGQERDNLHAGMIASILANVYRKKGAKNFTVDDFMVRDREAQREKSTLGFLAGLKRLAKPKKG